MNKPVALNTPKTILITSKDLDQKKVDKMARKAEHVRNELISSEEVYNRGLLNMKVLYLDELQNLKLLTPIQLNTLFHQIDLFLQTSSSFLDDLRRVVKDKGDVGLLFQQYIPFFNPYKFYAINHEKASILLRKLRKRSEFVEFEMEQMQKCNNQNIASLIILPVQRPPRYKLLLKELIKSTLKHSPNLKNLELAMEACSKLNQDVNESIIQSERREKVRECSRWIYGKEEYLMAPAREHVFTGELNKIDRKGTVTPYTFFLFTDLLIYAERLGEAKYKMHQEIEVNRMFKFTVPEADAPPNSFIIHNSVKTFMVLAESASIMENWKLHLTNVIDQATVSFLSNRQTSMVKPMLVADTEAKECQICEKVFTTINRRHHCRFCGKVVCGACSRERLKGDALTGVELRACTPCHWTAQAHVKYENELKQSDESMFAEMQLRKEQMEQTKKMLKLLVDVEGNPLVQRPDRIFQYKAELTKVCKNKNKEYNFFLFSDMLCYGVPSGDQTKIHEFLPIDNVFKVQDVGKNSGYPANSFSIFSSNKSFVVLASDSKQKETWISKLVLAKRERIESLKNAGMDVKCGQAAPIYTPDHFFPDCQLCSQKFTFTKRRHHCRLCGRVVCHNCSKQRMDDHRSKPRSSLANKKETRKVQQIRVCDWCVKEIEVQKSLRLVESIPFLHRSISKEKYWTKLKAGRKGVGSFFITADDMDTTFKDYLLVVWPEEGNVCREIHFKIYKNESGQEVIHSIDDDDIQAHSFDSFFTLNGLDFALGLKTPMVL